MIYYKLFEDVGDTVVYYPDSIVISKNLLSKEDFTSVAPCKRKLFLDNGRIVREIHALDYYSNRYDRDTIFYLYNQQKQIYLSMSIKSSTREYRKFKYDDIGNLQLIASEIYNTESPDGMFKVYDDTMWFQDYDDAPNLAKDLIIFQECFYRALSTNNFLTYIHKRYRTLDSVVVSSEERRWEFQYDENNQPIY